MAVWFGTSGGEREVEARKKALLRGARVLRGAPRSTRDGLLEIARVCRASAETPLYVEGAPCNRVVLLHTGRVRLERKCEAETLCLAHLGRGDFLGALSLMPGPATETAWVVEAADGLWFPVSDLRELTSRDPAVLRAFAAAILEQKEAAEQRLEAMLLRSVESRLAAFLLVAVSRWGVAGPDGVLIATALRHHEIAAMVGTGREWVTMTLSKLRERRIVSAVGRRILVRSLEALRALASGKSTARRALASGRAAARRAPA